MPLFSGCATCNLSEKELWLPDVYSSSSSSGSRRRLNSQSIAHAPASLLNNKDILTKFYIGAELIEVLLVVDTGSGIVWTSNKAPDGSLPWESRTVLCLESTCKVRVESEIMQDSNRTLQVSGRIYRRENAGGILGLDNGPLSFIKQLNIQKFSHCIPLIGKKGVIRFGSHAILDPVSIARISQVSSRYSAYYVHLKSIRVGNIKLPLPNDCFNIRAHGRGGFMVDFEAWWTWLIAPAYDALIKEIHERMGMEKADSNPQGLCYKNTEGARSKIPLVSFHFVPNAIIHLDPECVFYFGDELMCLAFGREAEELGNSILGNFQMTNFEVGYDVGNVLTFKAADCSS
ncbi:Beta-site APP-cleaving enzyme [Stylosanthes scabra]|uniref:Beta-site APP-cleaving enzyme n=1 Tax=Stylosanthes scabra TaxID=79078 RepID=A0ABU6RAL4_9FABA|nr:Beta-site APP-cleaving enzyme [Stylosanthes scabra]